MGVAPVLIHFFHHPAIGVFTQRGADAGRFIRNLAGLYRLRTRDWAFRKWCREGGSWAIWAWPGHHWCLKLAESRCIVWKGKELSRNQKGLGLSCGMMWMWNLILNMLNNNDLHVALCCTRSLFFCCDTQRSHHITHVAPRIQMLVPGEWWTSRAC